MAPAASVRLLRRLAVLAVVIILLGVAAAYSVAYCLLSLPSMAFALKDSPVKLGDVFSAVWRPAAISIASALIVARLKSAFAGPQAAILMFAIEVAVYCGAYALLWIVIPGGRKYVGGIASPMFDATREFLRKKPALNA